MTIQNLTAAQLRKAAQLQEQIAKLKGEVDQILGSSEKSLVQPAKRKMSAAGRAKIIAAQKARWAKVKSNKPKAKPTKKAGRKLSPEARAKIVAAQKARWAKVKAKK